MREKISILFDNGALRKFIVSRSISSRSNIGETYKHSLSKYFLLIPVTLVIFWIINHTFIGENQYKISFH